MPKKRSKKPADINTVSVSGVIAPSLRDRLIPVYRNWRLTESGLIRQFLEALADFYAARKGAPVGPLKITITEQRRS